MKTALVLCFAMITLLPGDALALTSGPVVPDARSDTREPVTQATTAPTNRRVWRGAPIRVDLPLDNEHIIRFPGATHLRSGLLGGPVPGLRVQVLGDHLYLLAKEPFAATRMIVQTGSGPAVLLDLAADARFPAVTPLEVLTAAPVAAGAPADDGALYADPAPEQNTSDPVGYVALVRHAAQSLYAPPRLIPRANAIFRAPLPDRGPVALVRGAHIFATPVASWRTESHLGALWITAVKLRNLLNQPVVLDPRDLRGQWRAASFQHARLGASGEEIDTTTVYLISDHRFTEAIRPWQSAHREVNAP